MSDNATTNHASSTPSITSSLIPQYDAALFDSIHKVDTFLPHEENEDSIRTILRVTGLITILHLVLLQIVKLRASHSSNSTNFNDKDGAKDVKVDSKAKQAQSLATWKGSYQLTNLLVNLSLGLLGIYYQTTQVPLHDTITNKIIGYPHFKLFAIGQIAYQLWALPVGILFVGETGSMILHHVAVICVASVSCFLSCGFRYYTPYFYGLIEISSVPLSIMNSFRNNPEWKELYPDVYSIIRMMFGVTFLLVRVVLWTPFFWSFFALAAMLLYSSESAVVKGILLLFNLSSLVLTMLQYFWASKIVKAMVGGSKKTGGGKKVD